MPEYDPNTGFDVSLVLRALESLEFPTLLSLTSYLAERNTIELEHLALLAEQKLAFKSSEMSLLKGQLGNLTNLMDFHQGGGTPVVDPKLRLKG